MTKVTRRDFLKVSALTSGGLAIGFSFSQCASDKPGGPLKEEEINAFIHIDTNGDINICTSRMETGQGIINAIPIIIADEMDAPWDRVNTRFAPFNPEELGPQDTGGSASIRRNYDRFRTAGAMAREMLVKAAADKWQTEVNKCTTQNGFVLNASTGDEYSYGELAEAASKLPLPERPAIKKHDELNLTGKPTLHSKGVKIVTGKLNYGIDHIVPGMQYAAIQRAPSQTGKIVSCDKTEALKVKGVKDIIEIREEEKPDYIREGVVVLADNTWSAFKAKELLRIEWDAGLAGSESTESVRREMSAALKNSPRETYSQGDVDKALVKCKSILESEYENPFLAHAPMEPMNAIAHFKTDEVEIWVPTQAPERAHRSLTEFLGVDKDAINIYPLPGGGGFGRRLAWDFMTEAVIVSKKVGVPVKVTWTREDDMKAGYFRSANMHHMVGGLDDKGDIVAWEHHLAVTSESRKPPRPLYGFPNSKGRQAYVKTSLNMGFWRAVSNSFNIFVTESFFDELAHSAGKDPLESRIDYLRKAKATKSFKPQRLINLLEIVKERSGWGKKMPEGTGQGVAAFFGYESYTALVLEVDTNGAIPKVTRVYSAADCGTVINPLGLQNQLEGGIIFGLSATLYGQITLEKGAVQQSSYADYPILRYSESPEFDTFIVDSSESPGGAGEIINPPVMAALGNAIFAASGVRNRKLPIVG